MDELEIINICKNDDIKIFENDLTKKDLQLLLIDSCFYHSKKIYKYIIQNYTKNIDLHFDSILAILINKNKFKFLKILSKHIKIDYNDLIIKILQDINLVNNKIPKKKLKMIYWILDNKKIDISYEEYYIFRLICNRGFTKLAKYVYNNYKIQIDCCNYYCFRFSCINGHLDLAKWLYSIDNNFIQFHANDDEVLRQSVMSNRSNIVKWLLSINSNYIIDKKLIYYVIDYDYIHNNIIKLLLDYSPNLKFDYNYLFKYLCKIGDLKFCKKIYKRYNINIIQKDFEELFLISDIKIIDWLYNLYHFNLHLFYNK
jgi:hypothetical protein